MFNQSNRRGTRIRRRRRRREEERENAVSIFGSETVFSAARIKQKLFSFLS
jgi:hypothetical protein